MVKRRNLLGLFVAAPLVLAAGQTTAQNTSSPGLAPTPADISAAQNAGFNHRLFKTAGTKVAITIGQEQITVEWAGWLNAAEKRLNDLRVKDTNSPNTFIAAADRRNVQILTPDGNEFELRDGRIHGTRGDINAPQAVAFRRGADLLRGVMASEDYKKETGNYINDKTGNKPVTIANSQFPVVVDVMDIAEPTAPGSGHTSKSAPKATP